MSGTGSRARVLFARVLRMAVVTALTAVMVPVGVPAAYADIDPVTYWVDVATGNDTTNPGSEAAPWKTISKALSVASGIDTIMVRPGTYSEANGETPANASVLFLSDGETIRSTGGANSTVIQGDGTRQLLVINGWVSGDQLVGFTFDNGATAGAAAVQVNLNAGAAAPDAPAIRHCIFSNNDGGTGGGGLWISGPTPGSALRVEFNQFLDNSATYGGAIKADSFGAVTIWNNDFAGNTAEQGGALILWSHEALFDVRLNDFEQNTAAGGEAAGGAVYWYGHSAIYRHLMAYNSFVDCTAGSNGGAVHFAYVQVGADSNYAEGGSAPFGGFAYLEHATVVAENNFFTGHSAALLGAVWNLDNASHLDERNDTVWAQTSGPQAARLGEGGTGTMGIVNCIYWNPLLTTEVANATSLSYTCSSDDAAALAANGNTVGAGMVYADPMIDTGAPPELLAGSPCIDAGNPADYAAYDFYEEPRPQGPAPDIGCSEYPQSAPLSVYRFFRPSTGTHFYTADEAEMLHVRNTLGGIYAFEGVSYTLNQWNNTTPLYRFFRPSTGTHFYTADYAEMMNIRNTLGGVYAFEGVSYNVSSNSGGGTKPAVYRFFKPSSGTHFYTADTAERDSVIANLSHIYQYEGPAFWVGQ